MNGPKSAYALAALFALLATAVFAHGASALGTTAYTCKQVTKAEGTAGFSGPHCRSADAVATNAEFEHFSIPNSTSTEVSTVVTEAKLKGTIAGSAIEVVGAAFGSGTLINSEVGGEMVASGEGKLVFSAVTERLLGCKVTGKPGGAGIVETKQLLATTAGQGDKVKFSAKEGTQLAEFELTECAIGPLTVKVFGNVPGTPDGATINFVHNTVTTAKSLRLQNAITGPVFGFEGSFTLGSFTPIGPTT